MQRSIAPLALIAAFAVCAAASSAAGTTTAGQAAHDATLKAKAVTYALLDRSSGGNLGTVTLQRIGSTRSRIRITLKNPASGTQAMLRSGRDCQDARVASAVSAIPLHTFSGTTSETIVNVPLTNLQSGNYLLNVQNATARQQAMDACARLGR
jgi:hypothetical protein